MKKPDEKPVIKHFSSGPCAKYPGFALDKLAGAPFGRSHRSKHGKGKLNQSIVKTKELLGLPEDYLVGIVPASDTGAFEMAMWSLLGERGVDVFYWESFGKGWANDIQNELKLEDVRVFAAEYGKLPDLSQADFSRDIVFTWNGTTGGVKVPDGDWIADNREGLTLCDATSAVYGMELPWEKLDVITYSWQKVLGGEAAHGMLILSPRAVARLEDHQPSWPMPKIFRLIKNGKVNKAIFEGSTINTPSMLANEDHLQALEWAESTGGLSGLFKRSEKNLELFEAFVKDHDWIDFLAEDKKIRSNTSVCLTLHFEEEKVKKLVQLLDQEDVAYDCSSYRDAPLGLRFWCGATVENTDVEKLLPWLEWAYEQVK